MRVHWQELKVWVMVDFTLYTIGIGHHNTIEVLLTGTEIKLTY